MTKILFRPTEKSAAPEPPSPPSYDSQVSFQISTRPPADFDKGLMKMSPANLPTFTKLEIYSKDAGGNVIGLWCECLGVPTSTGRGTQCSGTSQSQNGASYEVRFYNGSELVHTAEAIISQLYTEEFTVHYYPQQEATDWKNEAKVIPGNWPAGCSGMVVSYDPGFPAGDDCFEIPADAMSSGAQVEIDLVNDPTFYNAWAIEAYDGPMPIYQARVNLIVHEPY